MKAIKKLSIVFRIVVLFMLILFFYPQFKKNIVWGIAFITAVLIFILLRVFIFNKKYKFWKDSQEDYTWVPLYYVFGSILLLLSAVASYGTISDIEQGAPLPLWVILGLPSAWILGFLLIYYAYKSQKESASVTKKKEKPESIIDEKKIKKFWIHYLIAFLIVAAFIRYIFGARSLTPTSIIITISVILFMYFYLRIAIPTRYDDAKKKKYRVLFVILMFFIIFFGVFTYTFITGPDKDQPDKCVSKGIFPKNGIPGLQYCEQDSDCIKVINKGYCCDACHGGMSNAINKKHIDFWECIRFEDINCSDYECKENITSWLCFAQAGCVNNICELIEEPAKYELRFSNFKCKQNLAECYVNCTWEVYNSGNRPTRYKLNISFYDKELGRSIHNVWGMPYPEVPIYQDRVDQYKKDYDCIFGKEGFEYKKEFIIEELH